MQLSIEPGLDWSGWAAGLGLLPYDEDGGKVRRVADSAGKEIVEVYDPKIDTWTRVVHLGHRLNDEARWWARWAASEGLEWKQFHELMQRSDIFDLEGGPSNVGHTKESK